MNIFAEILRLGASNAESDNDVKVGIEHHINTATNDNIKDIITICNVIEVVGIDTEAYFRACKTLGLTPIDTSNLRPADYQV